MESDHFQRTERLFHEVLALQPALRGEHIRRIADGDSELASRIHRMIRYAERTSACATFGLLDSEPGDDSDCDLIGASVGPFHIGELLGKGGFGCVYRAEQQHPIQRSVALKILRSGMDSQQVIARFDSERQTLALMEHPNIARVLDAGRTEPALGFGGSRPYFAMELVEGVPITIYCDDHRLSTEGRLELFLTVCQALQHAHQKGIIHRDLKPSNILVSELDGVATPKVIDFGIAKATQQAPASVAVTEAQQLLGTPQYMSPEQADLDVHSIDTRSDIYSLGVVLYELLTGSTPLEGEVLRDVSYSHMQRMIREQTIERPSTRLMRLGDAASEIAEHHKTDIGSLRRRVRGDLDWIALKALDHDCDRRYNSASAFADDIRRHLHNQPVMAGPPSAVYRMRKFVRRHRAGVAAAALVTLAVIGGAFGTTLAMLRARDSAEQALSINQFMSEVLASANPNRGGADVRLVDVLQFMSTTVSQRFEGHPELEAQVRHLLGTVFLNLDMRNESISEFRQSTLLLQSIYGPDDRRTLEEQLRYVQTLLHADRGREAEQTLAEIAPRIQRVVGANDLMALEVQLFTAGVYRLRGPFDEAEKIYRQLRERATVAGADEGLQIRTLDGLVSTLRVRFNTNGEDNRLQIQEIESLAQEMAERSANQFGPEAMPTIRAEVVLAALRLQRGDAAGAAEACRTILATSEERLGHCHGQRQMAVSVLARALRRLGDPAAAADLHLQMIDCSRSRNGSQLDVLSRISDALQYLDRGNRWPEGEALAREFGTLLKAFGGGHDDMAFNDDLYIARFVSLQGRLDEAETLFQAMLLREHEADDDQSRARLHLFYGSQLARRGLYEQAERSLNAAVDRLNDIQQGTTFANPDDVLVEFIALYQAWGKPEKVEQYRAIQEEVLHDFVSAD